MVKTGRARKPLALFSDLCLGPLKALLVRDEGRVPTAVWRLDLAPRSADKGPHAEIPVEIASKL